VSPSSPTVLASGRLTASGDRLTIQLIQTSETPPTILFRWPAAPSVATPKEMDRVVAATMQVLAAAVIELAALRTRKRL
jgi:hypothetical protein